LDPKQCDGVTGMHDTTRIIFDYLENKALKISLWTQCDKLPRVFAATAEEALTTTPSLPGGLYLQSHYPYTDLKATEPTGHGLESLKLGSNNHKNLSLCKQVLMNIPKSIIIAGQLPTNPTVSQSFLEWKQQERLDRIIQIVKI
ncbi:hypothetical protein STEG23_008911, partial [Scotinomys teguina]